MKWKYKQHTLPANLPISQLALDEFGREGWEFTAHYPTPPNSHTYLFKKPEMEIDIAITGPTRDDGLGED